MGKIVRLTGASNNLDFYFDWVAGTTLTVIHDETGTRTATAVGHITNSRAIVVIETPEEILEMVGLDYSRITPASRIPGKNSN